MTRRFWVVSVQGLDGHLVLSPIAGSATKITARVSASMGSRQSQVACSSKHSSSHGTSGYPSMGLWASDRTQPQLRTDITVVEGEVPVESLIGEARSLHLPTASELRLPGLTSSG